MALELNGTTGVSLVQDGVVTAADLASGAITASALPAGSVIQVASVSQDTVISTSLNMNFSSALPSVDQGAEILSISFTPVSSSSKLVFYFNTYATSSVIANVIFAAFEDSTCISAIAPRYAQANNEAGWANLIMFDKANSSTTTRTYSVRVGGQPGNNPTVNVNSYPRYAGVPQTSLIIFEVAS